MSPHFVISLDLIRVSGQLLNSVSGPLFPAWNYWLLEHFFRLVPHDDARMNFAEFFIFNSLASYWLFAVAFYLAWRRADEKTAWRRGRLVEIVFACVLAVFTGHLLRQWLGAAAPALNPSFQSLFPPYLWGHGTPNSFPSDSTLVYFLVAAGLWPINRRWSAALAAWAIVGVSLPRVYMGGHFPTDVISSIVLAFVFLGAARAAGETRFVAKASNRIAAGGLIIEFFLFLWLFELGEGFRASLEIGRLMWLAITRSA
ncbi:MAG: phosphatase PAP2 family protein [Candidatus Acidiferrales bacterium]